MKVYIAAPYSTRHDEAKTASDTLQTAGHIVTSRWITQDPGPMCNQHAREDLDDVADADVLLALNPSGWEEKGSGGRHVELGYALALDKWVIVVGTKSNIFHYLDVVNVAKTTEEAIEWLKP